MSQRFRTVRSMRVVRWLLELGAERAASNAARVLDARRQADARVDALADRLVERIPTAA
jgi:hypothetical protein